MATISLNTSPHSEEKMLNGVLTFLGCVSSDKTFDKNLRSFKVWNCSPEIWSLRWPQRKKSKGFKSRLCDAHVFSVNLLMTSPSKWSLSHVKTHLAVWGAAPSCMTHCWPLASWPQNCPNARQKPVSTFIYRSAVTVSVAPSSLQNQRGPITPCALKATHAVAFVTWRFLSITSCGLSEAQCT